MAGMSRENGHLRLLLREIMEVRRGCLPSYLVHRSHFMLRKMTASDTGRSELEEHSLEELFGSGQLMLNRCRKHQLEINSLISRTGRSMMGVDESKRDGVYSYSLVVN